MTFLGRFLAYLERQNSLFIWLAVLISILGLGVIDYKTGIDISISLFYIFPVALATWALGSSEGILVSFICAVVWNIANLPADQSFISLTPIWNTLIRLGILTIVSALFSEVHNLLKNESRLSQTDFLTGIPNRRALFNAALAEMEKLKRTGKPFTFLYVDLDDFKIVNDSGGHESGDQLLASVATVLKLQLRGIDTIARIGGDEFALLLPETDDQAAQKVAPRLEHSLLEEMKDHHWPVTFSIGALTCLTSPANTDELIRLADHLMYAAKKEGKNTIRYKTYSN